MLFASGQRALAKRLVAELQEMGCSNWIIVHAYYTNSGGFLLHPEDTVPFPVTAKQIYYLVHRGHVPMSKITKRDSRIKTKAVRLAKTIAGSQVFWLVAPVVARGVQHLPVTQLELFTIALITCTGATAFSWFQKILGVETTTDARHSAYLTTRRR